MTISAYQVDNVIKAYNKQSKSKVRLDMQRVPAQGTYTDTVTLSGNESIKADAYQKISYNLLDVLLKDKKIAS
jgi:hypothetical protein